MRCVIIGGAEIKNYEKAASYIKKDDSVIICDSGLYHCKGLGVSPSLIVGDFDSYRGQTKSLEEEYHAEVIHLPREKDDTDSMYAIKEGINRGYDEFLLLGMVGNRFDHSFVNIAALLYLHNRGKKALIVDDYSEMEVLDKEATVTKDYAFFSLLNVFGEENEVSIEDAKFPLNHGSITPEYQFAVSNEVLPNKTTKITLHKGRVLLVRIF